MAGARGRVSLGEDPVVLALVALAPIALFVLLFALLPVGLLFGRGLAAGGGFGGLLATVGGASNNRDALVNSLGQGALSAAIALALGYPAGIFLGRFEFPGRAWIRAFLLLPFLLPTVVVAVGILDLFGPAGLLSGGGSPLGWFGAGVPAIVAANLVFNVPIVALFTALGCESASPTLEETAATLGAGPARRYRDVWAGPSLVGAAIGGILTFAFSALAFAAPILLCGPRCYTLEAQVYALNYVYLDPTAASLLALAAMLLLLLPIALYLAFQARLRRGGTTGRRPAIPLRGAGWPAALLAAETTAVFAGVFAVVAAVLYRTVLPAGGGPFGAPWSALFGAPAETTLGLPIGAVVLNTLGLALLAATIALVLVLLALVGLRSRPAWAATVGGYLFLPLLISPVLLAFSLAEFWRPLFGGEPTVWIVIGIAQATLALPFALQSLAVPLAGLSRDASEAVRALGATRWTAFWDADAPRLGAGLVTAALFAFALGLGEFTATYFLWVPSYTTLSVATYELEHARYSSASAGAAGLLALLSIAVFLGILAVGRGRARAL